MYDDYNYKLEIMKLNEQIAELETANWELQKRLMKPDEKPNKRNTKEIDDKRIIELVKQGNSYRKVAKMTGYTKSTVERHYKKYSKIHEQNNSDIEDLEDNEDLPF